MRATEFNTGMPHEMLVLDPVVEDVLEVIGQRVLHGRASLAVSQRWLWRACGLDQSTICRLEHGRAPNLRLERYARVIAVLESGRPLGPWIPESADDPRRLHARRRRHADPDDLGHPPGAGDPPDVRTLRE